MRDERYWVGGEGNWSDAANHWSDMSDGLPDAMYLPDSNSDVYFDEFSGLGNGDTVTLNTGAVFADFYDWVGADWILEKTSTNYLTVYGWLNLSSGFTLTSDIHFYGPDMSGGLDSRNCTITGDVWFYNDGEIRLGSNATITGDLHFSLDLGGSVSIENRTLKANDLIVENREIDILFSSGGILEITSFDGGSTAVSASINGNGTVKVVNNTASAVEVNMLGLANLYNLWLTGTGAGGFDVYNSFEITNNLKIDGASKTIRFEGGEQIDFGSSATVTIVGSSSITYTLTSFGDGRFTFSKSSGTIECDYIDISNSEGTGGATWFAGDNSTDSGNNLGWSFDSGTTTHSVSTFLFKGGTLINDDMEFGLAGGESEINSIAFSFIGEETLNDDMEFKLTGSYSIFEADTPKPETNYTEEVKPETTWST